MIDALHPLTHEQLQLGEGVLLRGVDLDAALSAASPAAALAEAMQTPACRIGVTRAGMVFRCVPAMLDTTGGRRTPAAGETLPVRWEATLSGTLLEITPANAALLLNQPIPDGESPILSPLLTPEAAAGDVCWIGSMGRGLLLIGLYCPISTGGMVFRAARDGLGEADFTLLAQQRNPADSAIPCRMAWLKEADA